MKRLHAVLFSVAAVGLALGAVAWWKPDVAKGITSGTALREVLHDDDDDEASPKFAKLRELEAKLAVEEKARQQAESEANELRAGVNRLADQVILPLGSVEVVGKKTGTFLPRISELEALADRDPASLSSEERQRLLELQRNYAEVLGMLPAIAQFQDDPHAYGAFFRNMIQASTGVDDAVAARVEAYMQQRDTAMIGQGLNASAKPAGATMQDAWEQRRDAFNAETATALRNLVTTPVADKAGIDAELMEFLERDFDKVHGIKSP